MALTLIGAVPKNQLDALPLYSASQATVGGTISLDLSGGITRFFSPTVLGISGASFAADANGFIVLVSNFIDISGCNRFFCMLQRTNVGVGIALSGIDVYLQYRTSSTDTPPTSLGALQQPTFLGATKMNGSGQALVFPAMQAAGEVQRAPLGWANDTAGPNMGAGTANLTPTTIGDSVRLFFNIGSAAAPAAGNVFSAFLWGAT